MQKIFDSIDLLTIQQVNFLDYRTLQDITGLFHAPKVARAPNVPEEADNLTISKSENFVVYAGQFLALQNPGITQHHHR